MALITKCVFMDLSIFVVSLIGFLYWFVTKDFGLWRKKGIPYLEPKPFLGNFQDLILGRKSIGEILSHLYFKSKGKPYVGIFGFHRPILLVRDPEIVKSILVKDFNSFRDRTFSPDERSDSLFVKNLFGLNGPRWRHLRVKLTPTFTTGKMKGMYDLVVACGKDLCKLMEREMNNEKTGVVEVREVMARYTTDVIASCGFGLQGNALKDPDAEFRRILRKVVAFDFWTGLKSAIAFFAPQMLTTLRLRIWDPEITTFTRRVVWETVEHREKTGLVRRDFLDLLMQVKKKGQEEDRQQPTANGHSKDAAEMNYELDGDDFVAQAFVFMAAGFETSSSTKTFLLYELARHPDVQARLREEIRATARAHGGSLPYDTLHAMPLMHQVVQETLRMYPILPFLDRVSLENYRLPDSGALIEKGTTVFIPIMGIQRDPAYFDDPDTFKPERFQEGAKVNPFTNLPFGEGPRICIGMRMAFMQVKVGLAYFLDRFEVSPSKLTKVPLELDAGSFLLAPKGGMHLTVSRVPNSVLQ